MADQPMHDEEQLDRQLAELEENPNAQVDSTVRDLYAELGTLADALKQPIIPDPFEGESACRRAVESALDLPSEWNKAEEASIETTSTEIPKQLEHFRILKLLGQGGMGAVYLAEDTRLGREVALKTMRAELAASPVAKDRFLREARLAAALENDHIVPIYHVGEVNSIPYLAMPLLKGQSLDDVLNAKKALSNEQVTQLGIQVARGLAAAHERGLIHRDIKPANLWVEPTGRVKILDFGLARTEAQDLGLTQSGTILGTPSHMAPEQARGLKVDGRADLYSLGVVLYRAATGHMPIMGADTMSMLMALATETPRPACEVNTAVSPALSALIARLLAKDPNARPASARIVIEELQALSQPKVTISFPALIPATTTGIQDSSTELNVNMCETTVELAPLQPAGSSVRSRHWLLVAAGLLLAMLPLGYFFGGKIIRIATNQGELVVQVDDPNVEIKVVQNRVVVQDKTSERRFTLAAGQGQIEVFEKDGIKLATREFMLTRGATTTVQVTLQELVHARKPNDGSKSEPQIQESWDADRRGAEYVLSIGGSVQINEKEWIAASPLPQKPFSLSGVDLKNNQNVTDASLAHFKDCKSLRHLYLLHTGVTDEGLAHFKDHTSLECLQLFGTKVTDSGLDHLKIHKGMKRVELDYTGVTDAGLARFKDCKNLTHLGVGRTGVTDAGLAHFKDCKDLIHLSVWGTGVTDAGLADFKGCNRLTHLYLNDTTVTDAGLAHFKDHSGLALLQLAGTRVTDKSLLLIGYQVKLQTLDISNTRISLLGYEQLKAALPNCKITWSEPNRRVAESVLALGGTVEISHNEQPARQIDTVDALPQELFQVRRVSLAGINKPLAKLPELLSQLRFDEFDQLEKLDLSGISGLNYKFLASIAGLEELSVANAGLKDDSLGQLPILPKLKRLVLDGNSIQGNGLTVLKAQPALIDLSLECPTLIDLKPLAELRQLKRLSLAGANLSDIGITHLAALENLEALDLRETRATAAGIAKLQSKIPKCKIEWGGRGDEPTIAGASDRQAAEYVLSIGGKVRINDQGRWIDVVPQPSFRLTGVDLSRNQKVTDAGLAIFKDCKDLQYISLNYTQTTDVGVAHLKDCRRLKHVDLGRTRVTDAGLAHFRDCKELTALLLYSTLLTDAGLVHFKDREGLTELVLSSTQITDAGLANFQHCKRLKSLYLTFTRVTDSGLAHLKDCNDLTNLNLGATPVSDVGLAYFADCKHLTHLDLVRTRLTDQGLSYFKECTELRELKLGQTRVTDAGLDPIRNFKALTLLDLKDTEATAKFVDELKVSLPKCRIEWDGASK